MQYGSFLADQIANSEGLESCRSLLGLREALTKQVAQEAREAEGEKSPDPNKRQRKATAVFEAAPSHTPRSKPTPPKAKPKAKV